MSLAGCRWQYGASALFSKQRPARSDLCWRGEHLWAGCAPVCDLPAFLIVC